MKRIPLTQGQFALVDDEDFEELSKYKWHASKDKLGCFRARRYIRGVKPYRLIFMHRQILNAPKGMDVDHCNHNTLDNQRHNLRLATRSQNLQNQRSHEKTSSKYKGVCWDKKTKKWKAAITLNKKVYALGRRTSEIKCAKLYDAKAKELFGEFALTNF